MTRPEESDRSIALSTVLEPRTAHGFGETARRIESLFYEIMKNECA